MTLCISEIWYPTFPFISILHHSKPICRQEKNKNKKLCLIGKFVIESNSLLENDRYTV